LVTVYLTNPGQKSADFNNVKGAVTDFNGRYKLESKSGTFNLTFSAVGFKTKTESVEVVAGQTTKLNVKLESSVLELNEVIYSENRSPQKIEEATVSVSLVKPELIQARNAKFRACLLLMPNHKCGAAAVGALGSEAGFWF
jgi:hypothetical protein